MTTSSDHPTPSKMPRPDDHWAELTATLSPERTAEFEIWIRHELDILEADLEEFVTPDSLRKSLRRKS